jgi:Tfp pilus assembly protein PilW
MSQHPHVNRSIGGFSLLELVIAMAITLAVMGIGTTVLSRGFNIRTRENSVSDASADAQRALNIMSREIANAGFRLTTNGIVAGDSDATHIRIRSNLNNLDSAVAATNRNAVMDPGEDIKYFINTANQTDYLVRYDNYSTATHKATVLANRMDSLRIHYFEQKVTYGTADCDITGASSGEVAPDLAGYVVIALCVRLPAVGVQGKENYLRSRNVLLVSDVSLRNANLPTY